MVLIEAGISATAQGSDILEIQNALKTASKKQTGNEGYPEYTAIVKDFVIVMEDKPDKSFLCLKDDNGSISLTIEATEKYALNGALFYAKKIIEQTNYKKIFAFG